MLLFEIDPQIRKSVAVAHQAVASRLDMGSTHGLKRAPMMVQQNLDSEAMNTETPARAQSQMQSECLHLRTPDDALRALRSLDVAVDVLRHSGRTLELK